MTRNQIIKALVEAYEQGLENGFSDKDQNPYEIAEILLEKYGPIKPRKS